MAVMGGFPFDQYLFRAITLERPGAELKALLTAAGYSYLRHLEMKAGDGLDELWVHASTRGNLTGRVLRRVLRKNCLGGVCVRDRRRRRGRGVVNDLRSDT